MVADEADCRGGREGGGRGVSIVDLPPPPPIFGFVLVFVCLVSNERVAVPLATKRWCLMAQFVTVPAPSGPYVRATSGKG